MIYLIISSIVVFMVCLVIILQKQAKQEQKDIDRPWRVVKNALGQYLVQNYKVVKKFWNDANPFVTYEWKWVTVETFDDEQETEYKKIVARVKAKVFEQANIEVLSVVTNRM